MRPGPPGSTAGTTARGALAYSGLEREELTAKVTFNRDIAGIEIWLRGHPQIESARTAAGPCVIGGHDGGPKGEAAHCSIVPVLAGKPAEVVLFGPASDPFFAWPRNLGARALGYTRRHSLGEGGFRRGQPRYGPFAVSGP